MRETLTYDKHKLRNIPKRIKEAHKGTYGHVLVIAGSIGMSGAAYLSALAAYRTGAGLVKILTVKENKEILQISLPEAIVVPYIIEEVGQESFQALLQEQLSWATVVVLGPGLGQEEYVLEIIETVLSEAYVPMIIDADALNMIAKNRHLTRYYTENIIITPHLQEMARLMGKTTKEIAANPIDSAIDYQDMYGITVVLKSDQSIVASRDEYLYKNISGTPALAKAGTGDVLTGVIAGLLCLGLEDYEAASMGSYIHGLAGYVAGKKWGEHGVIARDVIHYIPYVMQMENDILEN